MSSNIANAIAPELPYLRRFARALSGQQERGDAYVVATLETLVADSRSFRTDLDPRTSIYKAFLEVWNAIPINGTTDAVERTRGTVGERRIETVTPRPRQAFLLASVEGFPRGEIAAILDISKDDVSELIAEAGREIAAQITARVLIIEDEPLIALELESIVKDIGHDVAGLARTRSEAVQMAASTRPNLVLADIQLADGSSGIDAVREILSEIEIPVIFVTAYPERLLTGKRAEPAFLVSKPFKPETLRAIISQALFFDVKASAGLTG